MENDWKKRLGMVYSTDPEYQFKTEHEKDEETLPAGEQTLYVMLDKKNRKGKLVTLVDGFKGTAEDLKSLSKELKSRCGVGGSAKDGIILIQGDFRNRVIDILDELGYKTRRSGG